MSLSLTLMFYDPSLGVDQHRFSTDVLLPTTMRLPYGAAAMESLISDAAEPFHADWGCVWIYQDDGLKKITKDAYGKPLRHIPAGRMRQIMEEADLAGDILTYSMATKREVDERAQWWRATHAFIREINPEWPIVLYWH